MNKISQKRIEDGPCAGHRSIRSRGIPESAGQRGLSLDGLAGKMDGHFREIEKRETVG